MTIGTTMMAAVAQVVQEAEMATWMKALETLGRSLSDQAFWIGFGLVLLFAVSRFAVTQERSDDIDPPLVARSFTTRFRYYLSAAAYVGCYEALYIVLVAFGSFPEFQELLEQWIGSLKVPGHDDKAIGTPAWAALATSSLLPSVPGFKTVDQRVRDFLHRFASIPQKARALANEILEVVAAEPVPEQAQDIQEAYAHLSDDDRALVSQHRWLRNAGELLQDGVNNPRNASAYSSFFSRHSEAYKRAEKKQKEILAAAKSAGEPSAMLSLELKDLVDRQARFLSCALLSNEPSEKDIRETIRDRLTLPALPVMQFGFNLKQMIAGGVLIVILTIAAGFAALYGVLSMQEPPQSIGGASVIFIFSWVPYAVLMLLPPFVIAAGMRLYFADRKQLYKMPIGLEDHVLGVSTLAVAAYGLGMLPPLAGMAIGSRIEGTQWLIQILPFGLTPAALACIFFYLSTWNATRNAWGNFAVDFSVFAVISAGLIWFATWVATNEDFGGMNFAQASGDAAFTNAVALRVLTVTAGILGGLLGAFQCRISRQLARPLVAKTKSAD